MSYLRYALYSEHHVVPEISEPSSSDLRDSLPLKSLFHTFDQVKPRHTDRNLVYHCNHRL